MTERANRTPRLRVQGVEELLHSDEDPLVRAVAPIGNAADPAAFSAHLAAVVRVEAPQQLAGGGIQRHDVETGGRGVQYAVDHDGIDLQLGADGAVAGIERPCHLEVRDVLAVDLREGRVPHTFGSASIHRPFHWPVRRPSARRGLASTVATTAKSTACWSRMAF